MFFTFCFFYAPNRVEHLVKKVTELQETLQQYLTNITEDWLEVIVTLLEESISKREAFLSLFLFVTWTRACLLKSLLNMLECIDHFYTAHYRNNKIFIFIINPPPPPAPSGNAKIQKLIAKHIFECFEKRKGEDGKK